MLKKISLGVLALISVSVIFVFIVLLFTRPQLPSETSNSYAWLHGQVTLNQCQQRFPRRSALYRLQSGFLRISQDRKHGLFIATDFFPLLMRWSIC